MGCGCGKKTNVIRQSSSKKNNIKNTNLDRESRKRELKMIRVNATKRQAPKKK